MTSELPEQLRELADSLDCCQWNHPITGVRTCAEAAKEIERLRSEVDECRRLLREVCRDPERVEIDGVRCWEVVVTDEWMHAAQASGGGDGE